jgi:nucleobase:cation symporter-1, NCS1 family
MDNTLAVERRSIDVIPDNERHGSVRSLFTVWFSANVQITTVITGAVAIEVGASLPYAVLALVIGNLIGAIFMALHSAQGPKLGIPQMIQSRAQFGFYGAIVPLLLVVLMYVGFFAASAVLGGSALSIWWHIGKTPATIIVAAICTVLAIYGYRLIHAYERWIALVSGIGFLYLTIRLFDKYHVGTAWHAGHFAFGTFLLVVTLAITWQITYAPYVADYSRYLPRQTSVRSAFWWTYGGTVIGTIWMMIFGAIVASVASNAFGNGNTSFVIGLGGPVMWLVAIVLIGGVIAVNVLNLYGMFMCVTTTITALRPLQVRSQVRTVFILFSAVVGTIIAIAATSSFLSSFQNFILFLAYFMIPWTAINLTDFYFVRKEKYDMDSIFRADGIYGRFNIRTIVAYVVAVLIEIPFMSTTFYTGPLVKHLGGADISWIFGLIVAAGLYYILMRPVVRGQGEQAVGSRYASKPV